MKSAIDTRVKLSGFTLIELLVVIAIIAIMAAILFPIFATAREKARQTVCLSNGKQIGLAFNQYVQDYDELTPNCALYLNSAQNGRTLGTILAPYVKSGNVWRCPSDTLMVDPVYTSPVLNGVNTYANVSYAYNYYLMGRSKITDPTQQGNYLFYPVPVLISQLQTPSQDAAILASWGQVQNDTNNWIFGSINGMNRLEGYPINTTSAVTVDAVRGHNNGGTCVYADGHAKWLPGTFLAAQYKIESNAGNAYRAYGVMPSLIHE